MSTVETVCCPSMPRSGSTLTESILAAMPGVTAGGELTTLSETLGAYEQAGGRADALPGAVPQNRVSLAQIYTNAVRQRFPGAGAPWCRVTAPSHASQPRQ